jgi:AP-4 complex subunit mu-1
LELLSRLARVFKDFSGQLTEESVRKNFGLFYEILDEAVCFGLAQTTAVERLRLCIRSEAASDAAPSLISRPLGLVGLGSVAAPKSLPSTAVARPLAASTAETKNEIFVDLVEKLAVTIDAG